MDDIFPLNKRIKLKWRKKYRNFTHTVSTVAQLGSDKTCDSSVGYCCITI